MMIFFAVLGGMFLGSVLAFAAAANDVRSANDAVATIASRSGEVQAEWQNAHGQLLRDVLATSQQFDTLRVALRDYLALLDDCRRVEFMGDEVRQPAMNRVNDAEATLRTLTKAAP